MAVDEMDLFATDDSESMDLFEQAGIVPKKGFAGIAQDIKASFKSAPSSIAQGLSALPVELYASGEQIVSDPLRASKNIAGGLVRGGRQFINLPTSVYEYLGEKEIPLFKEMLPAARQLQIPETSFEKYLIGEKTGNMPGDPLLRGLAEFAPFARAGAGVKGLAGVGQRSAAAGLYGASAEGVDPIHAALMGLTAEGAIAGGKKAIQGAKKLRPSEIITSPLSPEELTKSLDIVRGTSTDLGSVIGNDYLTKLYANTLSKVPFSEVPQKMQSTVAKIDERGVAIMDEMLGRGVPGDIGLQIVDSLKGAFDDTKAKKNEIYEVVNQLADDAGVTLTRKGARNEAQSILNRIASDPDLAAVTDYVDMNVIKQIAEPKKQSIGDVFSGTAREVDKKFPLRETEILKGEIKDAAMDAFANNQGVAGKALNSIANALDREIIEAIKPYPEVYKARQDAHKWYAKNYAPFEDKQIMNFIKGKADPDTIENFFLKTAKRSDRANLLSKLQNKLPDEDKNLMAFSYFSNTLNPDGSFNPQKFNTAYKALKPRQRDVLIPSQLIREQLSDYSQLVMKNKNALDLSLNPKTGAQLGDPLATLVTFLGTGLATLGGGLPGLVGFGSIPLAARGASKYLTNPNVREQLVQKLIEKANRPAPKERGPSRLNYPSVGVTLMDEQENE